MPERTEARPGVNDGKVVLQAEECSLWYHPEIKLVHHCMHRPMSSKAFRDMLSQGAEVLAANRATKWLSDDRTHKVLSPEDADWGETVWFPRVRAQGFKYWGIVMPTAAIGKLNINRFAQGIAEKGVEVQVSDSPEELFDWLSSF